MCEKFIDLKQMWKQPMESYKEIQEGWKATREKLKQRFSVLTDNDLLLTVGKQNEMLGRLQAKLGKSKQDILEIISNI